LIHFIWLKVIGRAEAATWSSTHLNRIGLSLNTAITLRYMSPIKVTVLPPLRPYFNLQLGEII
ncbi:MAG: hypothetical protein DRN65_01700, partial [Thaumarchaeota archaeon]